MDAQRFCEVVTKSKVLLQPDKVYLCTIVNELPPERRQEVVQVLGEMEKRLREILPTYPAENPE
jgi:uncharacterized protein YsxB (DUF464 family)